MSVTLKKAVGYFIEDYNARLKSKVKECHKSCLIQMTTDLLQKLKKHKDRHHTEIRDLKLFLEYECKKDKLKLENFIVKTEKGLLITISDTEAGKDSWRYSCSLIEIMEYDEEKGTIITPIKGSIYPYSWTEWYSLSTGKKIKEEDRIMFSEKQYKQLETKYQKRFKNYGLSQESPFKDQCGMQPPIVQQMIIDYLEIELKDCRPVILTYIE